MTPIPKTVRRETRCGKIPKDVIRSCGPGNE